LEAICRDLDGIPLAIVLAARRLRHLSPTELLDLLDSNLIRALSPSMPDAPNGGIARAIQKSLDLIQPSDLKLLHRLCVFSGEFSWGDVVSVYEGDRFELLDGLERLADYSILHGSTQDGRKGFRVLDTIRHYMASMIQDEDDALDRLQARRNHAVHYCAEAQKIARQIKEGRWESAARMLWSRLGNLRSAASFAAEHHLHRQSLDLYSALGRITMEIGLVSDFDLLASAGLRSAEILGDDPLITRILGLQGAVEARKGNQQRCEELWLRRVELCKRIGNNACALDGLIDLAVQAYQRGDTGAASRLLDDAESIAGTGATPEVSSTIKIIRALLSISQGDLIPAADLADEAEAEAKTAHDREETVFVWNNIGRVRLACGDLPRALESYAQAVREAQAGDRRLQLGVAMAGLAEVHETAGRLDTAAMCLHSAVKLFRQTGSRRLAETQSRLDEFTANHRDSPALASPDEFENKSWQDLVKEAVSRTTDLR
jgi:hypothetical protein